MFYVCFFLLDFFLLFIKYKFAFSFTNFNLKTFCYCLSFLHFHLLIFLLFNFHLLSIILIGWLDGNLKTNKSKIQWLRLYFSKIEGFSYKKLKTQGWRGLARFLWVRGPCKGEEKKKIVGPTSWSCDWWRQGPRAPRGEVGPFKLKKVNKVSLSTEDNSLYPYPKLQPHKDSNAAV